MIYLINTHTHKTIDSALLLRFQLSTIRISSYSMVEKQIRNNALSSLVYYIHLHCHITQD